ncbi:MAG TPA: TIM44-like domain-containing protein [Humisphaera sp.]|nr:TIM44-like domain-containing protein [Humisphaera sp.]
MKIRLSHRVVRRLALALAILALLLVPVIAFARAGGGEGYSGGGGGGHGGGGGGGGGAIIWMIIQLFRLTLYYPYVGIPVWIIVIVFFIYVKNQGTQAYQSNVIRRGSAVIDSAQQSGAIEQLRAHDPLFDEGGFARRVDAAFRKIQQAWCDQNLDAVRAFISDGVHERFLLQFAEQRDAGWRDRMEGLTIQSIEIAQVESDGVYDVLSMRIAASAANYHESIATGKRLPGQIFPGEFAEVWTFIRRRGAHTVTGKAGLIEGNCPNCGAPIEMNQSANCTHCKAQLRSGEYDWVLAEITQDQEWDASRAGEQPGVAQLRQTDPDLNASELEDRASVMFWRKAAADRLGKIDPLRKIASPAFAETYALQLRATDNGQRTFFGECAVGSVKLLGVGANGPSEQAAVEIRWSAKRYISNRGQPATTNGENALFHTLFILSRNAGSKTDAGKGISSAHCPTCGAPYAGGGENACTYCGTVLNDGAHGWVLTDITARSEPRGREVLQRLGHFGVDSPAAGNGQKLPTPDRQGVLAWMIQVAGADGQIDPEERQLLMSTATRQNVSPAALDGMIAASARGALEAPAPADSNEALGWMGCLAETAMADGKISPEEFEVLQMVGEKVGVGDADIKLLINRVKAQRYEAAVTALREQKARGNGRGS